MTVTATLPPELVGVRVPRGVDLRRRDADAAVPAPTADKLRVVSARVARAARIGAPLETIGYVTGPDDPMPLDDRGVDRNVVARRAARNVPRARSSTRRDWRGFCTLPGDYTF